MARNIFNSIKMSAVKSSKFDLSHDLKLSFSMGELVPTTVMDVIPGDIVNISTENMLRFAPLIAPVMHRMKVHTHYFFVPNRLVWPEFTKWITGDSTVEAPYSLIIPSNPVPVGSIGDYLGIPAGSVPTEDIRFSPLPAAAYALIYDEYYRDQNLQDDEFKFAAVLPGDNNTYYDNFITGSPLKRAWQHDYFTSALPFAQKGSAVQIPLVTEEGIDVYYENQPGSSDAGQFRKASDGSIITGANNVTNAAGPSPLSASMHLGSDPAAYDPNGTLKVDVQANATDINTLRRAFKLQEWLEKNARGGTRYIENILSHFGVKSSDARLQRPEYIGGDTQLMTIGEVLATAQSTDDGIAVGSMAGHGISVGGGNRFSYRAEEHGYIIGIISVRPDTAYQDGLHRHFSRFDRLDYAWPLLANIGEQEVLQKEVYMKSANPNNTFGYVPRFAEYKFMNSRVAGEFRTSLAYWHLGRIFASDPSLSSEFIQCNPDTRIFAVTDPEEDHIYAHIYNNITAIRKLPKYGIPQL